LLAVVVDDGELLLEPLPPAVEPLPDALVSVELLELGLVLL
jgi:hypothetical protein